MTMKIEELVEKGELSQKASENMKAHWVTNVNELYFLIRSTTTNMDKKGREELSKRLEISENKLEEYMKFIESYVDQEIVSAPEIKAPPTGCLISPKQMEKIKWINSLNPEEYKAWQKDLTKKFYKENPEYRGQIPPNETRL